MTKINCKNCHHFDVIIDWYNGIYYKCLLNNKLGDECNDYDPIHGDFEMIEWKRQVSRVYADGQSYNCSNKVTAKTLQNTLNTYEKRIQSLKKQIQYNNNHEEIKKQLNTLSQHTT